MASAYPHNLKVKNLESISAASQKAFAKLEKEPESGVSRYRIFEVYEEEPRKAALGTQRMKFQQFEGTPNTLKKTFNPPIRPGAKYLWGWVFESYFADMPRYLQFLWNRFVSEGGFVRLTMVDVGSLLTTSKTKHVINCLGLGAIDAVNDSAPAAIVRGKQVLVPNAPMVADLDGVPLAYNYTPTADIFSRADGLPEYVHFFPRSQDWVLGQTREPGTLDIHGNWVGSAVSGPHVLIGETLIPTAIIDLNDELLRSWVNVSIDRNELIAREGLRYYRDPDSTGVRLECENVNGTRLVHNYGHGGSGITMSWGCAQEVVRLIAGDH